MGELRLLVKSDVSVVGIIKSRHLALLERKKNKTIRYNKCINDISNSTVGVDNNDKNRPRDLTKYKRTTKFFLIQTKFSESFSLVLLNNVVNPTMWKRNTSTSQDLYFLFVWDFKEMMFARNLKWINL